MGTTRRSRLFRPLLLLVAALLAALGALAVPAAAAPGAAPGAAAAPRADSIEEVADALRDRPVYVDPRASDQLSESDAKALSEKIESEDKPVFVAVLPKAKEFPEGSLLPDLRSQVGERGVYAVALGDDFAAASDRSVLSHGTVRDLDESAERGGGDTAEVLDRFVDGAVGEARGEAPASWDGGTSAGRGGGVVLAVFLALFVVGAGAALVARKRARTRRAEQERAQLEKLRPLVDEDITAFGEELDRIAFDPGAPETDDAMREDYTRAIDAYDEAKRRMAHARGPDDVRPVTESLEDGRFALATLEARREGRPLPERHQPCFFDPRHGPSVQDVQWAPPGGTERAVPVCAADAARLADGDEPMARTVDTPEGRRPYWEAGPAYAPWAGGYFGGGLLPGLLAGTLLGNALAPGWYGAGYGDGGGDFGGDFGGGDFGGGDFGGGGFGGGDFGGGGF